MLAEVKEHIFILQIYEKKSKTSKKVLENGIFYKTLLQILLQTDNFECISVNNLQNITDIVNLNLSQPLKNSLTKKQRRS